MTDRREDDYKRVECPYYKRDWSRSIICEGYTTEVNVQQNFLTPGMKKEHMDSFCFTPCWVGCTVAQLAADKYDEM